MSRLNQLVRDFEKMSGGQRDVEVRRFANWCRPQMIRGGTRPFSGKVMPGMHHPCSEAIENQYERMEDCHSGSISEDICDLDDGDIDNMCDAYKKEQDGAMLRDMEDEKRMIGDVPTTKYLARGQPYTYGRVSGAGGDHTNMTAMIERNRAAVQQLKAELEDIKRKMMTMQAK